MFDNMLHDNQLALHCHGLGGVLGL